MLDEPPGTIGFTVPRTMHRVPVPGVTLRRRVLDPADRTVLHGVAVTTPTCTVLETAPVAGPRFLDRALQRHVGFAELHAACCRHMGARGHVDAERFAADRRKGNALGTAGWVLLRFTWADLTGAPELVVRRVREVLAAAA